PPFQGGVPMTVYPRFDDAITDESTSADGLIQPTVLRFSSLQLHFIDEHSLSSSLTINYRSTKIIRRKRRGFKPVFLGKSPVKMRAILR
ncbi:MAG: hypothetical protein VKK42_18410, partial [Lyngbya sp.]|nr:hypothetical protein [Lyngbya sp.]